LAVEPQAISAGGRDPTFLRVDLLMLGCRHWQAVSEKVAALKLFGIFSLRWSLIEWNFANSLAINIHIYLPIFFRCILIFHQMALIFPRVPIVFTLPCFEYSPRKRKRGVPAFRVSDNSQRFTGIALKLGRAYQWENCLTTTNCACRRYGRSPTAWFMQNGWNIKINLQKLIDINYVDVNCQQICNISCRKS